MSQTSDLLGPIAADAMRVLFLYVGQGEATLVLMPDGTGKHLSMLVDCNRAEALKGVNLVRLLEDLLPRDKDNKPILDVFANTHPHSDHLSGLDDIRKAVRVDAVWHSGHKPSSAHDGPYGELAALIAEVKKRGGTEMRLEGSRSALAWGTGEVHVLSPAVYVVEEIENESPEQRDARIHDQCAVMRVAYGSNLARTRVLLTGDSDKTAWMRITGYHGKPEENRVQSHILSASHHGSYTFFKDRDDDPEPYEAQMTAIAPERVIISAPDPKDSKHGHPDKYAVERYEAAVGKDNVHHMGSRAWSFFVDVFSDGTYSFSDDRGRLAQTFSFDKTNDGGDTGGGSGGTKVAPPVVSRIERSRPMGLP